MNEPALIPQPFIDWYEIWAGQAGVNEHGETGLKDPPTGVQLSVQPARRSEIFFRSEKPWEQVRMVYPCVIHDEGRYRMWFWTWGEGENRARYNGYAESANGFDWERPELGLASYEGSTSNNLLSRHEEFEINTVFLDPTSGSSERFKAIGTRTLFFRNGEPEPEMDWDRFNELRTQTGYQGDPTVNAMNLVAEKFGVTRENAVMGAVSAEGLRWSVLPEPLVNVGNSVLDTQNVAAYEPESGEYVAYLRGMYHNEGKFGYGGRRAVRKVSGREFGNWSPPRYVLVADPQDHVSDDIYTSCYCHYPDVPGLHLMFPSIYHRLDSEQDVQLAVSRDGWHWVRPERKPIITLESDTGRYGRIRSGPNLVALSDEEWGLPYDCRYSRHDHGPAELPEGEFRWALWKRDRLVALEAPVEGRVTTIARICHGRELHLNFQTRRAGWIRAEIVTPPTEPNKTIRALDGFTLEDCDPLAGDEMDRVVTWKGQADLSSLEGKQVAIRLHLARAKLFSTAM